MDAPISELYILGIGFDMHHGIKSGYGDFKKWLHQKDSNLYNRIYQVYDHNGGNLWSYLEYNLGLIEPNVILDPGMCLPWLIQEPKQIIAEEINISDCDRSSIASEIYGFKDLFFYLRLAFEEWIDSLGEAKNDIRLKIHKVDSFFINFNYTTTLETAYSIPDSKILYIHGCASRNENLIFGHNKTTEVLKAEWLSNYDDIGEDELDGALDDMKSIYKDVNVIIKKHQRILDKLNQVKKVHIWGLSISDIDLPYIEYLKSIVTTDAIWELSWYTPKDEERIEEVTKLLSLSSVSKVRLADYNRPMPKQLSLF